MEILSGDRHSTKVFLGTILNPKSDTKCDVYKDGALVLKYSKKKQRYVITGIGTRGRVLRSLSKNDDVETIYLGSKVIMPSFFDMHFHWVQDHVRTMPKDSLLTWLDKYTFPAEAKFADSKYASAEARRFFKRLAKVGTLGGACYSSIHPHALECAMNEARGDFVIGNVLMTMNSPEKLIQSTKDAVSSVKNFAQKYGEKYCLTPRFAITTDASVMEQGAEIVKKYGSFTQTHLSETPQEIETTLAIYSEVSGFEKVKTYTEIYKNVGLLGRKTILGHCIHLSDEELKMISRSKSAIAHCPSSNAPIEEDGLGSGLFDFKLIEKHGIRWALASDIGGGPHLSMFDVMRSFVEQNRDAKISGASYVKALYRSTLAGAEILSLEKTNGNLNKNKCGNFIVVNMPKNFTGPHSAENIIRSLIDSVGGERSNFDNLIHRTYLNGEQICG